MKHQDQLAYIKAVLDRDGKVSRNWALQRYISRLGSVIYKLKLQGYDFTGEFVKTKSKFGSGKDYIYRLTKKPK